MPLATHTNSTCTINVTKNEQRKKKRVHTKDYTPPVHINLKQHIHDNTTRSWIIFKWLCQLKSQTYNHHTYTSSIKLMPKTYTLSLITIICSIYTHIYIHMYCLFKSPRVYFRCKYHQGIVTYHQGSITDIGK